MSATSKSEIKLARAEMFSEKRSIAIDLVFIPFESAYIQPQVKCSQPHSKLNSIKGALICKKA